MESTARPTCKNWSSCLHPSGGADTSSRRVWRCCSQLSAHLTSLKLQALSKTDIPQAHTVGPNTLQRHPCTSSTAAQVQPGTPVCCACCGLSLERAERSCPPTAHPWHWGGCPPCPEGDTSEVMPTHSLPLALARCPHAMLCGGQFAPKDGWVGEQHTWPGRRQAVLSSGLCNKGGSLKIALELQCRKGSETYREGVCLSYTPWGCRPLPRDLPQSTGTTHCSWLPAWPGSAGLRAALSSASQVPELLRGAHPPPHPKGVWKCGTCTSPPCQTSLMCGSSTPLYPDKVASLRTKPFNRSPALCPLLNNEKSRNIVRAE